MCCSIRETWKFLMKNVKSYFLSGGSSCHKLPDQSSRPPRGADA